MSITNLLLFLILVTLATYLFTPWNDMKKPPLKELVFQWFIFFVIVSIIVIATVTVGFVTSG
jgi:hypothetical protein